MSTIVVGVDGSAESAEALRVAFDEARRRAAHVKVVYAWHVSPRMAWEARLADVLLERELSPSMAHGLLEWMVAEAGADAGVEVTTVVREGTPAVVLCEEAKGADLLVVGSRGHGGLRSLLLGSVSRRCTHDATCPVLVVSNRIAERDDDTASPRRGEPSSRALPAG